MILVHASEFERMRHDANMRHVAQLRGGRVRNAQMCPCGMHTTTQQQPECRNLTRYEVTREKEKAVQTTAEIVLRPGA